MARFVQIFQDLAIYAEFWQYLKTFDAMRQDTPHSKIPNDIRRELATLRKNTQNWRRWGIFDSAPKRFDAVRKVLATRGNIPNNT